MTPTSDIFFVSSRNITVKTPDVVQDANGFNLAATSDRFGIVFLAAGNCVKCTTVGAIQSEHDPWNKLAEVSNHSFTVISIGGLISGLSLSADDLILAVFASNVRAGEDIPFCHLFDVRSLAAQDVATLGGAKLGPFYTFPASNVAGVRVVDVAFNPVIAEMFAVITSDGVVTNYEAGYEASPQLKLHGSSTLNATCCSWSPKGKQLVVGKKDGSLSQLKPSMIEAKSIPAPVESSLPAPFTAKAVFWAASTVFLVAYWANDQIVIVAVVLNKNGPTSYSPFVDVCFGALNDARFSRAWFCPIAKWNLVLVACRNSSEVGVLQHSEDRTKWTVLDIENSRAGTPFVNKEETYPIGVCVCHASSKPVERKNESVLPPSPMLLLLNSGGSLSPFHVVHLHPPHPAACPAEMLLADGARKMLPSLESFEASTLPQNQGQASMRSNQRELGKILGSVPAPVAQSTPNIVTSVKPCVNPLAGSATASSIAVSVNNMAAPGKPALQGAESVKSDFIGRSAQDGKDSLVHSGLSTTQDEPTGFNLGKVSKARLPAAPAGSVYVGSSTAHSKSVLMSSALTQVSQASTTSTNEKLPAFSADSIASTSTGFPTAYASTGRKNGPSVGNATTMTSAELDASHEKAFLNELDLFSKEVAAVCGVPQPPLIGVDGELSQIVERNRLLSQKVSDLRAAFKALTLKTEESECIMLDALACASQLCSLAAVADRDGLRAFYVDPVTKSTLKQAHALAGYLERQLVLANDNLDEQLLRRGAAKTSKTPRPTFATLCRTISLCDKNINALRHELEVIRNKKDAERRARALCGRRAEDLTVLADSLLRTNISSDSPQAAGHEGDASRTRRFSEATLSPAKREALRAYLRSRPPDEITPERPKNASNSLVISRLSLAMEESRNMEDSGLAKPSKNVVGARVCKSLDGTFGTCHDGMVSTLPKSLTVNTKATNGTTLPSTCGTIGISQDSQQVRIVSSSAPATTAGRHGGADDLSNFAGLTVCKPFIFGNSMTQVTASATHLPKTSSIFSFGNVSCVSGLGTKSPNERDITDRTGIVQSIKEVPPFTPKNGQGEGITKSLSSAALTNNSGSSTPAVSLNTYAAGVVWGSKCDKNTSVQHSESGAQSPFGFKGSLESTEKGDFSISPKPISNDSLDVSKASEKSTFFVATPSVDQVSNMFSKIAHSDQKESLSSTLTTSTFVPAALTDVPKLSFRAKTSDSTTVFSKSLTVGTNNSFFSLDKGQASVSATAEPGYRDKILTSAEEDLKNKPFSFNFSSLSTQKGSEVKVPDAVNVVPDSSSANTSTIIPVTTVTFSLTTNSSEITSASVPAIKGSVDGTNLSAVESDNHSGSTESRPDSYKQSSLLSGSLPKESVFPSTSTSKESVAVEKRNSIFSTGTKFSFDASSLGIKPANGSGTTSSTSAGLFGKSSSGGLFGKTESTFVLPKVDKSLFGGSSTSTPASLFGSASKSGLASTTSGFTPTTSASPSVVVSSATSAADSAATEDCTVIIVSGTSDLKVTSSATSIAKNQTSEATKPSTQEKILDGSTVVVTDSANPQPSSTASASFSETAAGMSLPGSEKILGIKSALPCTQGPVCAVSKTVSDIASFSTTAPLAVTTAVLPVIAPSEIQPATSAPSVTRAVSNETASPTPATTALSLPSFSNSVPSVFATTTAASTSSSIFQTPAASGGMFTQSTGTSSSIASISSQSAPAFGAVSQAPTNTNAVPSFGTTTFGQTQQSSFGTPAFGQQQTFGTAQSPSVISFGQSAIQANSLFGSQANTGGISVFGSSQTSSGSAFGGQSAFGAQQQTPTGTGSLFGKPVGQSGSSPFGQKSTFGPSTGATSSLFGGNAGSTGGEFVGGVAQQSSASPRNVFGSSGTFGQNVQQTASPFGISGTTSFGSSPIFGQTSVTIAPSNTFPVFATQQSPQRVTFGGAPTFGGSLGMTSTSPGGFGAPPSFGSAPVFGAPPSFGAGVASSPSGTALSSTAAFGSVANTPTFGLLAQQQDSLAAASAAGSVHSDFSKDLTQAASASPQSPAFTQYRG